ncbi:topoisomerase [Streptococcus halitosis]|uniref:topoisomerase n=1 Tax=Streptococcus halitosis TaxID=2172545 RepID=UPI0022E7D03F|nr:topoisomerase [Streptococcus halitosis]
MSCSENLKKEKELSAAISNLKIEVLQNDDKLSSQSLSNIKRQARDLYECLVWLQYAAEENEN